MSTIDYYTAHFERTPRMTEDERKAAAGHSNGRELLVMEAMRIVLAAYGTLHQRGKMVLGINPEDVDEAICAMAIKCAEWVPRWNPARGMFTTYLWVRILRGLLAELYRQHQESSQYVTDVFDRDQTDEYELGAATLATDDGISELPVSDLIYAEAPVGILRPYDDVALNELVGACQRLADGTLSPRAFAGVLGMRNPTAVQLRQIYRQRDKLLECLSKASP